MIVLLCSGEDCPDDYSHISGVINASDVVRVSLTSPSVLTDHEHRWVTPTPLSLTAILEPLASSMRKEASVRLKARYLDFNLCDSH